MADYRDLILHATKEASRLHRDFDMRAGIDESGGRIDVFSTLIHLDVSLLFRPLDTLLGAYLPTPIPGVLVSTFRELPIQRFTAAHELGHFALAHNASLDGEGMLRRSPYGRADYEPQEVEADAFAAHFLMPRWIFETHARRQGWGKKDMMNPINVYQMSLRVGASYSATCYALQRHKIISRNTRIRLLEVEPRQIKASILEDFAPDTWRCDVWILTEADSGGVIEGGPSDLFVLRLKEKTTAGYTWNLDQLREAGFAIVRDEREDTQQDLLGASPVRSVTTQSSDQHAGHVLMSQVRTWDNNRAAEVNYEFDYDLYGKETGLPRIQRRQLLAYE